MPRHELRESLFLYPSTAQELHVRKFAATHQVIDGTARTIKPSCDILDCQEWRSVI